MVGDIALESRRDRPAVSAEDREQDRPEQRCAEQQQEFHATRPP